MTIPTTTTTTTTLPPRSEALKKVETILVTPSSETTSNDASGTKGTMRTINSCALSFGPLAPGETSETKIIYLRIPYSQAINNIKLALVDTGEITFSNNIFGVETKNYLDYNLIPSYNFSGLNTDNSPNNTNNIVVGNGNNTTSQYVYLNVKIPLDQKMGSGTIRYRWYFSYAVNNILLESQSTTTNTTTPTTTTTTTTMIPSYSFKQEILTSSASGTESTYYLSNTPTSNETVIVYINGIMQLQGIDYNVSGKQIAFSFNVYAGANAVATYNSAT